MIINKPDVIVFHYNLGTVMDAGQIFGVYKV